MKTIFDDKDLPICSAYLTLRRDDAVEKLGVGAGTISRTWAKLQTVMGPGLENLKELSFELKVGRATVREALDGFKLRKSLKDNGIEDLQEIDTIVKAASKIIKDSTISIPELMDCSRRMLELERSKGKSYSELEQAFNDLVTKTNILNQELPGLEREVQEAKKRKKEALEEEKTTEIQLKEYIHARDNLSLLGVDVGDLPKLSNMLHNADGADFDQKNIIDQISKYDSLINEMSILDGKLAEKKEAETELEFKTITSEAELKVLQSAIANLETAVKKSDGYVEEFRKTTNSITSELKNVKVALDEAKPIIQDFSKVIKEADEAAATIAKGGTIRPLLQMIKEGKGSEVEVLTSITQVLGGFDKWLKTQDPPVTGEVLKSIQYVNAWVGDRVSKVAK